MSIKENKYKIETPKLSSEEINEQIKPILRKMEAVGIRLDCDALKKLDQDLSKKLEKLRGEIFQLSGKEFNLDSPIQMAEVLFADLKLPTDGLKKTKSGISTAAGELAKIKDQSPIIPLILEYRELAKLISTYLRPLPILIDENSRLHTTYGLETATGRLTSSEPNLQNIPIKGTYGEEMRAAFTASPGMKLIAADYSQIELRVIACLSSDAAMIEAFKSGADIHSRTAAEIFGVSIDQVTPEMRRKAKAVNFGIVYGQTPYGLSQVLSIPVDEAAKYIHQYFDIHKGIKNYINEMIEKAHSDGFVETLFGAKRYLPNINSHIRYIAEAEERAAINTPVQGTAAEILKLAMIKLDERLEQFLKSETRNPKQITNSNLSKSEILNSDLPRMLLTVHDEIIVETPAQSAEEVAKIVKETMESAITLCVPIEVSVGIGDNWATAK